MSESALSIERCRRRRWPPEWNCRGLGNQVFESLQNLLVIHERNLSVGQSDLAHKVPVEGWRCFQHLQNHKLNYLAHKYSANRNRKRRRNKAKPRFLLFLYVRIYVIFKRIAYLCDFSDFFRGLQNRVSRVRAFVPLPKKKVRKSFSFKGLRTFSHQFSRALTMHKTA